MILARARGRYGNQLFFLSVLAGNRFPREHVICTGLDEIDPGFLRTVSRFRHFRLEKRAANWLEKWAYLLARARIFGLAQWSESSQSISRTSGFLPILVLAREAYQRETLIEPGIIRSLRDHNMAMSSCKGELLDDVRRNGEGFCFVHVRRGDYTYFPSPESPAALEGEWFVSQVRRMENSFPGIIFLVFSDDVDWCRSVFAQIASVRLVESTAEQAFCLMSLCGSGIMSPSSLSWWAAKLASESHRGPYVAPKFWFWWRQGRWVDNTLRDSSFIDWVVAS